MLVEWGPTDPGLSHVTNRINGCAKGPRFIGGDFNHFIDELSEVQALLKEGWEEAQHLAHRKFGQVVAPTIQQKHTKDLLFLSPDLLQRVIAVKVEDDWVANHSIVCGTQPRDRVANRCAVGAHQG